MTGNEDDAARQSRQNFRDDVQSAIWLHEKSKEQNRERREAKTAADLFVQAASLRPRRFKNRLARTLAAGPNSRRDAEELERSRWVHNLTLLLTGTDTPSGRLLASRQSSGQFLGAGLRASTLRGKVRNLRKFMAWLATTHQEDFPTSYLQYIQYLQVRQSEPSNRGALKDCHASFQFLEEVAGLPAEQKQTSTELYTLMYKEVLSQATPGRPVRQSPRMFVKLLAEIESLVIDPSKQTNLRIFGWWVLLQSWGTLRFSDHRGLVPKQITVDDTGFTGVLSRSKTLGTDKTVGSRPVFVHAACFVRERNWLSVGWRILLEAANFDRDYLLPVPTSSLQGCLQAELLYAAGFAILNRLLCALQFSESQRLVPQVAHFWTPHSGRSFMPSCAAVLGFEKSQRDFLGGWSAHGSDRYARIAKLRVGNMQKAAIRAIHSYDQEDPLGEAETSLARHMKGLGLPEEQRQKWLDLFEQRERPRDERVFSTSKHGLLAGL